LQRGAGEGGEGGAAKAEGGAARAAARAAALLVFDWRLFAAEAPEHTVRGR